MPQATWKFCLIEPEQGTSIDQAASQIAELGFNPWAFDSLELVAESHLQGLANSNIAVRGPLPLVEALRRVHDASTNSSTSPVQELNEIAHDRWPLCSDSRPAWRRRGGRGKGHTVQFELPMSESPPALQLAGD